MEVNNSEGQKILLQKRETFDNNVVPTQQEILKNLSIGTLQEKVGEDMSNMLNNVFEQPKLSTHKNVHLFAEALKERSPEAVVSEFQIDGKRYLAAKHELPGITIKNIEVFQLPSDKRLSSKLPLFFLTYKHLLYIDTNTGATADFTDLVDPKTKVKTIGLPKEFGYAYAPGIDIILISAEQEFRGWMESTALVAPHEAGHAHQQLGIRTVIENMQNRLNIIWSLLRSKVQQKDVPHQVPLSLKADRVVQERNAWAFAFATIRRYKELGLDLTQLIDQNEAINLANKALLSYENGFPNPNLQFSKKLHIPNWIASIRNKKT
jgi:hypothetical protein